MKPRIESKECGIEKQRHIMEFIGYEMLSGNVLERWFCRYCRKPKFYVGEEDRNE